MDKKGTPITIAALIVCGATSSCVTPTVGSKCHGTALIKGEMVDLTGTVQRRDGALKCIGQHKNPPPAIGSKCTGTAVVKGRKVKIEGTVQRRKGVLKCTSTLSFVTCPRISVKMGGQTVVRKEIVYFGTPPSQCPPLTSQIEVTKKGARFVKNPRQKKRRSK